MSGTTQYTTFSDLYTGLQNDARVATGVTATEDIAKRYVNLALQDIHVNYDYRFPWTERRGVIRTHAPYTTGTVDVSVGGTTVTGTSSLWATANSYSENNARTTGKLLIAGGSDIYKITTVTDDTHITLTDRYVASSAADDDSYIYFEDEYALASDFLRPLDMQFFSQAHNITLMSRLEFRRNFPRPNVSGRPTVACILDLSFNASTTPVRRVQFYPYPDSTYIIPYSYITSAVAVSTAGTEATALSATTDEPIMPLRYRHVIVLRALAMWYKNRRDDARSQETMAEYIDTMNRIVADVEVGTHNKAQVVPRLGSYVGHAKRPYSPTSGRRFSTNNSFDRME